MSAALALLAAGARRAQTGPFFPPFGIDLTAQDKTTRPQDDFFQFENGAWLARTPIPADQASVTMGRDEANRVEARLHTLLEAASAKSDQASMDEGKVGAMYAAYMDAGRIDALGAAPIQDQIRSIRTADRAALALKMGQSAYDFGSSFFAINIDVDLKDPARYAVYLTQNGLGMPDRDYYLEPQFAAQRLAYEHYVARLLTLVGWRDPDASADAGRRASKPEIAKVSWTKAQQRDLARIYNPASPGELSVLAPGFPWKSFLSRRQARVQAATDRGREDRLPTDRRHLRADAGRDPESLVGFQRRRRRGLLSVATLPGRPVRVSRQDPVGPTANAAALEAGHRRGLRR